MEDLRKLTTSDLLALHAKIGNELRERGIARTSNNPTGELAGTLFCKAFGWKAEPNSYSNIDATDTDGKRYQIKGRRITSHNKSRQLSAIRELDAGHFDFLAAVLFDENYRIMRAAIIPRAVVVAGSTFVARTNSSKFILRDKIWEAEGVIEVTEQLRAVAL